MHRRAGVGAATVAFWTRRFTGRRAQEHARLALSGRWLYCYAVTTESEQTPAVDETASDTEGVEPPAELDPLEEATQKAAALKDQLLRTAADFDNFRKRSRREVDEARSGGRESMLRDLLPVFDNLERATAHLDTAADVQSLAGGVQMVIKQFSDTLNKLGIERVPGVGASFDPNVHEAIQQLATSDFEPGVVAAEVQGGYRLGERLIRPAMVVVAKALEPAADEAGAPEPTSD